MIDFLKGIYREVFGSPGPVGPEAEPEPEDDEEIVWEPTTEKFEDDTMIAFKNIIIKQGHIYYIRKNDSGMAVVVLFERTPTGQLTEVNTGETFDEVVEFFS